MTVSLTPEKACKIKQACKIALDSTQMTIQDLAELVGKLVASFPGVMYGPLYYRRLDNHKIQALKLACGNYQAKTVLPQECKEDLTWWAYNVDQVCNPISHGSPDIFITTDASTSGWGGVIGELETGGKWTPEEAAHHVNYLELLAVFLTLCTFCKDKARLHIRVSTDNAITVAYLNGMGGRKKQCNEVARRIWIWCKNRLIWITAAHLPGVENTRADKQSRDENSNTEWRLDTEIFRSICDVYGTPTVDLFASRLNYQLQPYVSWKPDPGAWAVDALTLTWTEHGFYAFPPFSLIPRCLQKISFDQAEGILIAPLWPTQPWFAKLLHMLTNCPLLLPRKKNLLTLIHKPQAQHPLHKLRLCAFLVSGRPYRSRAFRDKLLASSCPLGETLPKASIPLTSRDGSTLLVGNAVIHMHHL